MMLVRLIIFIVLVGLLIFVYRKITNMKSTKKAVESTSMKKCSQCGVHLPEKDALRHNDHYFCKQAHQQAYLDQHPDE